MLSRIKKIAAQIKLVIFDVDGVFTDGRLHFAADGTEHKIFYVQDGLGVKLLMRSGVEVAVLSGRSTPVVTQRMHEIGIQRVYQGQEDKMPIFNKLLTELKLTPEQVAYVGDDLPDLPLIKMAGLGIAVPNAVALIRQSADWETQTAGGHGAVREVCEFILQAQKDGI